MNKLSFLSTVLIFSISAGCAQKKDHVVTIKTRFGDMVAILYDETPKHKENFLKLAREHYYDSLLFHRIIQGFMIQGGDPESRNSPKGQRLGNGGPNYTIEPEFKSNLFHEKGSLSAARLGDAQNPTKASSGSQFYIVHGRIYDELEMKTDAQKYNMALQKFFQDPQNRKFYDSLRGFYQRNDEKGYNAFINDLKPVVEEQLGIKVDKEIASDVLKAYTTVGGAPHLDGQYTVFGKVIKGLEVIDKIASLPKDGADRPLEDVAMFITVEEMTTKKIEKLYGYTYPD